MIKSQIIIIVILIIYIYLNRCDVIENLIDFDSDIFYKYYDKNNIIIDADKHTLTKNGVTINYDNHFNTVKGRMTADNKIHTKLLLQRNEIPTPKFYTWNSSLTNLQNLRKIKHLRYPLVIKPIFGTYGRDVYMGIQNPKQLLRIVNILKRKGIAIMIEEQVEGDIFRVLVFNNEIIDIYRKEPSYVIGDGQNTLKKLIEIDKIEKEHNKGHAVKTIDWKHIRSQGYTPNSIIPLNTKIVLTLASNVNNGAVVTPINLQDVHPDNIKLFKHINNVVGLNLNGIDFITYDLRIPYYKYGYIIENNARPGVEGHYLMNPKSMDRFFSLIKFEKVDNFENNKNML